MSKKAVLLDGHSLLNRAFYGVPDLTNSEGKHTGAVFGFLNIMFKILSDEAPDYLVVAFDEHAPTFRHAIYADYKGTRKPMPDALKEQVPVIRELLRAMGILILSKPGLEADDIIGTAAGRFEREGIGVTIVSGDRDLLQLVTDTVKMLLPRTVKGVTEVESFYAADVLRVYEVPPKGIIELKALEGDTSDNIPGVPKVGHKTATELIKTWGNIDEVRAHLDEISKKSIRESLTEHFDMAELSRTLATINTEAEIDFDFSGAEKGVLFTPEAYEIVKRLELKSVMKRFEEAGAAVEESEAPAWELQDLGEVEAFFSGLLSEEKMGLGISFREEGEIEALALALPDGVRKIGTEGFVTPLYLKAHLEKLITEGKGEIFTAFVKEFIRKTGIEGGEHFHDTELLFYLADPLRGDYAIPAGAEEAARFCFSKGPSLLARIREEGMEELYRKTELPLSAVLSDMERFGVRVKAGELQHFSAMLAGEIETLERKIIAAAGHPFNINSPKQLSVILFEEMKLPGGKKTKTGYSTSAQVLEKLADDVPFVRDILEYRTLSKLKATYADALAGYIGPDGRIHSTFHQTITATGRLSSADPNLQNIPIRTDLGRELRRAFVPEEGWLFTDADYSQIELRILASLSGDERLIAAYREEKDIHAITASQVFHVPFEEVTPALRRNAKAVNFGIVYGISSYGLSQGLSISRAEASEYIEKYFETYPGVKQYLDSLVESARKKGYAETFFHRRRPMPELHSSKFMERAFGERVAMNAPIQGTAADIIKIAMVRVRQALREQELKSRLILQVHDELLVETYPPETEAVHEILRREMMGAAELPVPLEVEIKTGANWLESH